MKLIFERSVPGRHGSLLPPCDVPKVALPEAMGRQTPLRLPEMSETGLSRHYTALSKETFGVNDGFYPLGSCTMKYNPRIDEEMAALPGFSGIHPLQPARTVEGCREVLGLAEEFLCEITGMDRMTFLPAAGAHGEFTALLMIKKYHLSRGDLGRKKMLVPDSAHGTNPASAAMAGFTVVNIPSGEDGCVDLDRLREAVGADTAGLMLTNPNTLGIFERHIEEIAEIVHGAGGLVYYDGANLNAIMGRVRPGDMGFDVVHLNLHKTFSTPHGGGGPGSGPVGCKALLAPFLPVTSTGVDPEKSIGRVKGFYGNFLVVVRALTYLLTLGKEGISEASGNAVLHANYMMHGLADLYPMAQPAPCMHEFVMSLAQLKKEREVSALDVAKALLDHGVHPPTMYFPLIVHEALMAEPTETETKETLDEAIAVFRQIYAAAVNNPAQVRHTPVTTPVGRADEVKAARTPVVKYSFEGRE